MLRVVRMRFNSMKVRLKRIDLMVKQGKLTGFNSMKVRLKHKSL